MYDLNINNNYYKIIFVFEASSGAAARVTVKSTGCGFDAHSKRWNIYLHLYFHFFTLVSRLSAALSSATQHAMPPEFGRMWGTECLNTRFPLPTLLVRDTAWSWFIWFILTSLTFTFEILKSDHVIINSLLSFQSSLSQ